jgi:HPt (histidine-containing phosphotransfer) domain-containing protein
MEGEYLSLLNVFLDDSAQRLLSLQEALVQAPDHAFDLKNVGQMAHSFKGSSSNMGAFQLAKLCHQLEELAHGTHAVSHELVQQLVLEISSEYQIVQAAFDQERKSLATHH